MLASNSRKSVDTNTVVSLAESINKVGLLNPIIVREVDTDFILVAGLHRLEAFHHLERDTIPAFILPASTTKMEARMAEIAENLHRAELTVQERSDQVTEWINLAKEKRAAEKRVLVQVAPKPQGGRPEGGIREAERELGIEHTEAVRAVKIASIIPDAKEAARNAGIDDNQSKLLKVAAAPAEQQVSAVHKIAEAKSTMAVHVKPAASLEVEHSGFKCPGGFYALTSKQRDEVIELAGKLGRFDVILVDFPWSYKTFSKKGMGRSAERHYDCMTIDEIAAYPISAFAADDCVLLSWTTAPFLALALDAMRSQGFTYKTGASWDKEVASMGFWFRGRHEHLLLGTSGSPRPPEPADRSASVIIERGRPTAASPTPPIR
jgi:ParB family chromosome partitioning protein